MAMAAMAASPSASSSTSPSPRPRQRSRKDVFKPRFPLDPFAGSTLSAAALGEPWFLRIDALLSATALQRSNVLFVLGAPSLQELAPLLQSRHLAKSLVILATHKPPDIPGIVIPAVRVLRLTAPLALEDAGAVRFVNILEWAERVARSWRKHGGGGVLDLSEETDSHGELIPPSTSRFGSQSTPTSPGSSSTYLGADSASPSRPSSRPSSIASSIFARRGSASLPPVDPSQRPFDVLVNFMPENVSDKALLKNSILVTTISRPFLTSSVRPAAPTMRSRTTSSSSRRLRPQSIFGAFSRSSTSVYMPPTPPSQSGESLSLASLMLAPPGKAILVHLLPAAHPSAPPAARRKLVESLESFLLSFAFQSTPQPSAPSGSSSSSSSPGSDPLERARPYVMQATTFCDVVGCEPGVTGADYGDFTVADVVLSGALDADSPTSGTGTPAINITPATSSTTTGAGRYGSGLGKMAKRAWVAAAADLVIMPAATDEPTVPFPAPASVPVPMPLMTSSVSAPVVDQQKRLPGLPPLAPNRFEKRSSSAPILTSEWTTSGAYGRRASHPHLSQVPSPPPPAGKNGQGDSGLPTPPHSSDEGEMEDYGNGKETLSASVSSSAASTPSRAEGGQKRPRWKFWRRLGGHGHDVQSPALKA